MKEFFKARSYDMVRMFLNQFAIGIFGFVLALVSGKAQNPTLRNVTGVFAILFYLFLLYTMTWELGFHDKAAVDNGRKKAAPLTGLWISLCANIPNFVLALLFAVSEIGDVTFLNNVGALAVSTSLILHGMYSGVLVNSVMGVVLNSQWWIYFLICLPAILTCAVAYWLGLRDKKFTGLFDVQYPESDRDPKPKKKK